MSVGENHPCFAVHDLSLYSCRDSEPDDKLGLPHRPENPVGSRHYRSGPDKDVYR